MIFDVFIRRPRLAMVISIVITLAGLIAMQVLPGGAVPEIAPPTVQVERRLLGRRRQDGRGKHRPAARERHQRRRRHALHEVHLRERRLLFADRVVPPRHRSRYRHRQRAEPRQPRDGEAARGGTPYRPHHLPRSRPTCCRSSCSIRRTTPATSCSCRTSSPSTFSTN